MGTESRLMTVFELLRQMVEGNEADPEERIRELEKRKVDIDREITRIREGQLELMDAPRLRDRFQQMADIARELLGDFREVEQNFRHLDRATRERIALWSGSKAELLDQVFGASDAIAESDQGRSFRAFWDFLMASDRQEELSRLLNHVFQMDAIRAMEPDPRLKRVHHDWLEAGEHTQRTVALLSQQLRRFLDDQGRLENMRIMELLRHIEVSTIALHGDFPPGPFMDIDESKVDIFLPMERTLFAPAARVMVDSGTLEAGLEDIAVDLLFTQVIVDKGLLESRIRRMLEIRGQITLPDLLREHPLEQGLAELVTYLAIASEWQNASHEGPQAVFDDGAEDAVVIHSEEEAGRHARIPRIIFSR